MATISLLRVDNRLIHGQVATGWISISGADKIVVIDDKSAANEMMRDLLEMATPPGIELKVYSVDQAVEEWLKSQFGDRGKCFVIVKSIPFAYKAYQAGFFFKELQIGGTSGGEDRKKIEGAISVNKEEVNMLQELAVKNVKITLQQTVQSNIMTWADAVKKLKF